MDKFGGHEAELWGLRGKTLGLPVDLGQQCSWKMVKHAFQGGQHVLKEGKYHMLKLSIGENCQVVIKKELTSGGGGRGKGEGRGTLMSVSITHCRGGGGRGALLSVSGTTRDEPGRCSMVKSNSKIFNTSHQDLEEDRSPF